MQTKSYSIECEARGNDWMAPSIIKSDVSTNLTSVTAGDFW